MHKAIVQLLSAAVLLTVPVGCSTIHWDKDWIYEGTAQETAQQNLTVVSSPKARLYVNGNDKGETPLELTLPYSVTKVKAAKRKYETSFTGKTRVLDTLWQNEEVTHQDPNIFHFQAAGHHDLFLPVVIPYTSDTLEVRLEKAGIINDIECRIKVEARREYFPDIESIVAQYAVKSEVSRATDKPLQMEGQNIYSQTFSLIVKDSIAFDGLVTALLADAEKKHFVFDILDAKTEATFSTNVLDTGIEHVVSGKVRAGSRLFLIQGGKASPVTGIGEDGRFAFRLRLSPAETFVYLVSKYKEILVVYKKIDVFTQEEEELTEEAFAKAIGVSKEQLEGMIQ